MISNSLLPLVSRLSEKVGSFGAIVAAMGCASCFPAIASLGASLNTLLPIFAIVALVSNVWSAWFHRRLGRMLLGIAGPLMILATLYLFWTDNWSTYMFYLGLATMFTVSIYDIVVPPTKACDVSTATETSKQAAR
jgi:mercuric ion transport protein